MTAVDHVGARLATIVLCSILVLPLFMALQDSDCRPPSAGSMTDAEDSSLRTVRYTWYDFFNVPYGEWWIWRYSRYEDEIPTTDSFPYINWHYYNSTHLDTFSSARLNVSAQNLVEVNMNERPLFLPLLSGDDGPRGGNARIDWYMQYLTVDEMMRYHDYTPGWVDGWVVSLNGTVALDRIASMAVMNMTSEDFDDFDIWWEDYSVEFHESYIEWALAEGNDRLDVFPMFEFPFAPLCFSLIAEKISEEIVITYDIIAWGTEALMTRWLRDGFMPTEWWFEDFTMHAEIGPESADLDIDTAVAYAVRASETNEGGEPCWVWQGMLQDIPVPSYLWPYNPYSYAEHLCRSPGSAWYDWMVSYEYTPGCFNLSSGETMTFICPEEDILFLEHIGFRDTDNTTAQAVFEYSEPLPSDVQDTIEPSSATRILTFNGPIDFWAWSQGQTGYDYLSSEWDRLGLLPYGLPYVEFAVWPPDTPPIAHMEATHSPTATTASQYLLNATMSCDSEDALSALEFRWDLDGDGAMDTDWDSEPTMEHDFGGPGEFRVSVSVKDTDNMTDVAGVNIAIVEVDPPVTTAHVTGTEGMNGWLLSWATVALVAEDESGIRDTYLRLDDGGWEDYVGEFEISSEGEHKLEFYSVDYESNHEAVREVDICMDMTPPSVSFLTGDEYTSDEATISWTCSDYMSGFNSSMISIDGGAPVWIGANLSHSFYGLASGSHTLTLTVCDNAGNVEPYSYTFAVTSDTGIDGKILYYVAVTSAVLAAVTVATVLLLRGRRRPDRGT